MLRKPPVPLVTTDFGLSEGHTGKTATIAMIISCLLLGILDSRVRNVSARFLYGFCSVYFMEVEITFLLMLLMSIVFAERAWYLASLPFNFQTLQIGLFRIAGALIAPRVRELSGRTNPQQYIKFGLTLRHLSLINIEQQVIHVNNQTRIYAILPETRNHLNSVFMSVSFLCAACELALGLVLWHQGQWPMFWVGTAMIITINFLFYNFYSKKMRHVS
ncbi:hypothetical protein [Pedobacter sp. JCM 36344]|uniref:hypothetical protein n=1 Tax=Pedobacter sp. JCM 36344 TaxID=3374280 RepID=UPI003979D21E